MSVVSSRTTQIAFSGDVTANLIKSAVDNPLSLGMVELITLDSGPNVIDNPAITDTLVTALTIIPPSANTILITLKGDNGDIGIPLSLVDPTTISLDTTFTSLVLDAADEIVGVQLIWN